MRQIARKLEPLIIFISITFAALIISYSMSTAISVRPKIRLSQVSAISSMQIWYWFFVTLALLALIYVYYTFKIKFTSIIEVLFYIGITLNIAFVGAASRLSLSKTPLPPGAITGDNHDLLMGMVRAEESGWSGNSYPPVWLSLVGNIARFSGNTVLEIWKPVYLLSLIVFPVLVLLAWRQVFNPLVAAAFTFFFSMGAIDWKSLAFFVFIAMTVAIVYEIAITQEGQFKFNRKNFFLGVVLGISALTYSGYLWWSLLALLFLILGLWFSKIREERLIGVFDATLGFALIFGPSQVSARFGVNGWFVIALLLAFILIRIMTQNNNFIVGVFAFLAGLAIPASIIILLVTTVISDSWFYPELEENPIPNIGLGFNVNGLLIIFIIGVGIILSFGEILNRIILLTSLAIFLSAALMMFWFASRMEVTGLVELFPRASQNFSFSWSLINFIAITALLSSRYFARLKEAIWPTNLIFINNVFLVLLLLFPLLAIHARALSTSQEGLFPRPENGAWYAYQACDNPNENGMLAEIFRDQPFIQEFLRENCPKVDWPPIPSAN